MTNVNTLKSKQHRSIKGEGGYHFDFSIKGDNVILECCMKTRNKAVTQKKQKNPNCILADFHIMANDMFVTFILIYLDFSWYTSDNNLVSFMLDHKKTETSRQIAKIIACDRAVFL